MDIFTPWIIVLLVILGKFGLILLLAEIFNKKE